MTRFKMMVNTNVKDKQSCQICRILRSLKPYAVVEVKQRCRSCRVYDASAPDNNLSFGGKEVRKTSYA